MTYEEANDAILGLATQTWESVRTQYYSNDNNFISSLFYESIPPRVNGKVLDPNADNIFAKVYVRHSEAGGSAIGKLFDRVGFLRISVFFPNQKGLSEGYKICEKISEGYEGVSTPNGVWFRDARIREIGLDERQTSYQMDFITNFTFSQRRN